MFLLYTMRENDATNRDSTSVVASAMSHNKRDFLTGHCPLNNSSKKVILKQVVDRNSTGHFSFDCNNRNRCRNRSKSSFKCKQQISLYKISLLCIALLCLYKVLFAELSSINIKLPESIDAQSTASFEEKIQQQDRSGKVKRISPRSLVTATTSFQVSNLQKNESNKAQQLKQQQSVKNSTRSSGCSQPIGGHSDFDSSGIWNQKLAYDYSSEYQNYSFGYTQSRVSNFVKPTFYTLRLKVDPTKRKFSGQLMINLDINSPNERSSRIISDLTAATDIKVPDSNSTTTTFSDATIRDKNGELGYRYLTLHNGGNINIRRAFYVFTAKGSIQIPATKIGKDVENELLTIDFYPNVITSGQGLLLIVYTGNVNEHDSQGLFVHHSQKAAKRFVVIKNGSTIPLDDSGLATHMQPNFARRLLPSWDEPHLKARFNLIVILPFRGYQSISNMPIKRKSISLSCSGESLQEIEFQTTPTMSTYLLTLVIGRFDYIESITPNNCRIRAYVYSNQTSKENYHQQRMLLANQQVNKQQQQQIPQEQGVGATSALVNHKKQAAQMALEVAVETFDRFETLLGVKYPLNKFDMIALREFDNGGMENWGASIFHENYLLYDNSTHKNLPIFSQDIQVNGGKSHRLRRLIIPLVVAHEIAHQWFGNLLTSHSWTYLWLNEGFAQFLMYDVANSLFPNENYWHIFTEDIRQSAMHEDELIYSSRALEFELDSSIISAKNSGDSNSGSIDELGNSAKETQTANNHLPPAPSTSEQLNLFDQLTYNKGAMIVRMVYHLLGRKQFFAGLQHYLLKHSYDTVTSHDLWFALEESTGRADMQLESQMINWLRQEGYPVINVQVLEEPFNYRLILTQERFQLLNDSINASASSGPLLSKSKPWSIPVSISSEFCPEPSEEQLIIRVSEQAGSIMNSGGGGNGENLSNQYRSFVNFVLAEKQASVLVPKSSTGAWLKLNFNATGYFRVNYMNSDITSLMNDDSSLKQQQQQQQQQQAAPLDNQSNNNRRRHANNFSQQPIDMLARMSLAVKDKSMCVIDRFNLVDDLFAMVKSGRKQTAYYLRYLIEAFGEETEIIVLRAIVESLRHIKLAIVSNSLPTTLNNANVLSFNSTATPTTTTSSSDYNLKFMSHYERYVQKYLRKLSQNIMRSVESIRSGLAVAAGKDASHQMQLQLQLRELKESEDLIGAHRIQYNDFEMVKQATDLFSRHFRQQPTKQQQQQPPTAFDTMDRELRASIYSAALMGTNLNEDSLDSVGAQANLALLNDELSGSATTTLLRNSPPHVTTRQLMQPTQDSSLPLSTHSASLSSIFATFSAFSPEVVPNSPPFSSSSSSSLANSQLPPREDLASSMTLPNQQPTNDNATSFVPQASAATSNSPDSQQPLFEQESGGVFLKLLRAYETSDSSNERYAICTALGSVEQANKQIQLLNLTLFQNYFKPHDIISILDSMAKTKPGRKHIWETLKTNTRALGDRQLLVPILKSLSPGLIETTTLANRGRQQHVETFLRSLYQPYGVEYGKLIGQTIETMRINTQWFRQDHDTLLKYLNLST